MKGSSRIHLKWLARAGAFGFLAMAVAGCSTSAPYVHSMATDAKLKLRTARICYSAGLDAPQDVLAEATKACATINARPKYLHQDLLACPVLRPWRAVYACQPLPKKTVVTVPDEEIQPADPDFPPNLPEGFGN